MKILNLGCGSKTSNDPCVVNVDRSALFVIKLNPLLRAAAILLLNGDRKTRFDRLPDTIVSHDLTKPLPFNSGSVDAVYHSHVLEHFDRPVASAFLLENLRVLKPGGILRVVIPDFELQCRAYLRHLNASDKDPSERPGHDVYIGAILSQSVQREASGTSKQSPVRRFIENLFLGDARARGQTHQWMYDRISLVENLASVGFTNIRIVDYTSSQIPRWNEIGLDLNEHGEEYKQGSLYVEAHGSS